MTCKHEPIHPIATFAHTCKHCFQLIEPDACKRCDGSGGVKNREGGLYECPKCKGTGFNGWRLLP